MADEVAATTLGPPIRESRVWGALRANVAMILDDPAPRDGFVESVTLRLFGAKSSANSCSLAVFARSGDVFELVSKRSLHIDWQNAAEQTVRLAVPLTLLRGQYVALLHGGPGIVYLHWVDGPGHALWWPKLPDGEIGSTLRLSDEERTPFVSSGWFASLSRPSDSEGSIEIVLVPDDEADPGGLRPLAIGDPYPVGRRNTLLIFSEPDPVVRSTWRFGRENGGDENPYIKMEMVQGTHLSKTTAFPDELTIPGGKVHFYATAPRTFELSATAFTARGARFSRTASLPFTAPRVVGMEHRKFGIQKTITRLGILRAMFGGVADEPPFPGVAMEAIVERPPSGSALGWLQLVQSRRVYTRFEGPVLVSQTGIWLPDASGSYQPDGSWHLDGSIPYANENFETVKELDDGRLMVRMNDSPNVVLYASCSRIQVQDHFLSYLVYRPHTTTPEPRWIALGHFEWSWRCTIENRRRSEGSSDPRVAFFDWGSPRETHSEMSAFVPGSRMEDWVGNIRTQIDAAARVLDRGGESSVLPPLDWLHPRLIRIQLSGRATPALRDAVAKEIGAPIDDWDLENAFLTWASPADADRATSIDGISGVGLLPLEERIFHPKVQPQVDLLARATAYLVLVAPFCQVRETDVHAASLAQSTLSLTLEEVALDLEARARRAGTPPTSVGGAPGSTKTLMLHFATPTGAGIMEHLALHPQVQYVRPTVGISFDDPVEPPPADR